LFDILVKKNISTQVKILSDVSIICNFPNFFGHLGAYDLYIKIIELYV